MPSAVSDDGNGTAPRDLRHPGVLPDERDAVYFVSATAFNLLGIDRWARRFRYVNHYESFDGHHPNVFVLHERSDRAFESIEEIVNYLLGHKEVADLVAGGGTAERRGKATFLMFDE